MARTILALTAIAFLLLSTIPTVVATTPPTPAAKKLPPVAIGVIPLDTPHYRMPREDVVLRTLENKGALRKGASEEEKQKALEDYYTAFLKRSDEWLSPEIHASILKREKDLASPNRSLLAVQPVTATIFGLAVDFGATETLEGQSWGATGCVTVTQTITGPLAGQIPHPGAIDNNTLWYSPTQLADASIYNKLVFGYEGAGRVRMDLTDPDDGQPGINLAGYTVQDYYDHMAGVGNVYITGLITGWVTVPHSEGYYGAPNCPNAGDPADSGIVPVGQVVIDALTVFSDTHPGFYTDTSADAFWPKFNQNGDQYIDAMWIIHAGMGEEEGGGAEGEFSIWSHSWSLSSQALTPFKVYEGDPGTTDDDIYVNGYTVQPEMAGVGVMTEEFGHNFFALQDLYTTDARNSVGWWSHFSSWMGWLGGATPVDITLWHRMNAQALIGDSYQFLNWQEPMTTVDYDDPTSEVQIGNLERPDTMDTRSKGLRINLPDVSRIVANQAGTGQAAWAECVNSQDRNLSRDIAIGAAASGVLTMDVFWDLETGYDYAYVEINGTPIQDTTGHMVDDGTGKWALNGHGSQQTLSFDLSAYAGQTITLNVHQVTDIGTNWLGTWVDNVMLDGVLLDDFETATAPDTFPGWTNDTWQVVPINQYFTNYYLVEWRTKTKYDQMLKTAYISTDSTVDTWRVERHPYNIPGAVVYYRNSLYGRSYSQRPWYTDSPSYGPKGKLLVVDMNYQPVRLPGSTSPPPENTVVLNSRTGSYDAALTLQATQAFTLSKVFGVTSPPGPYYFPSKPAVTTFNDTLGYYAGWYFVPPASIYTSNWDGSAVIPARGLYSTRVTDYNLNPFYGLYGVDVGIAPSPLGSGDPGGSGYDPSVQHGVNVDLVSKTGDDAFNSTATLRLRNYSVDLATDITHEMTSDALQVVYKTLVENTGNETAYGIELYYWMDPDLTLVSVDTGAGVTTIRGTRPDRVQPRADDKPNDELLLTIPELAAGETMLITVVGEAPAVPGPVNLYSELWPYDGQVYRGPWWLDSSANITINYLPLVGKNY